MTQQSAAQTPTPPSSIRTVTELNGPWTDGNPRNALIRVTGNDLKIDMSQFHRPAALGRIVGPATIAVAFPDDRTYTGQLESGNRIRWSNGSVWRKLVRGLIDLNGYWTDGSPRRAFIFSHDTSLTVDMSEFGRPMATGTALDISTIRVKFPDEATHVGSLHPPDLIEWDNNSSWKKL